MTRKSITTSHAAVGCDVCGRTLLRGEQADVFITGGSRRMVCELCTARATHEGWIREGMDLSAGARRADGAGRSLLGRLRARRGADAAGNGNGAGNGHALPPRGAEVLIDELPPVPPAASPEAPPTYEAPRSVRAIPTNAELKMARALELFNASEHPRRMAGVARSLGTPLVAVRPSVTEGSVVGLVVAWELSWYRFEVDLADEIAGVRVVDQGTELAELDAEDRVATAVADERGELALVA